MSFLGLNNNERPHPSQRQDRMNAIRFMIYNCTVEGCSKVFPKRSDLSKHCLVAHALILKNTYGTMKPILKQLHCFYLLTTPLTRASRIICMQRLTISSTAIDGKYQVLSKLQHCQNLSIIKQLARRPTREEIDVEQIKTECNQRRFT